MKRLSDDRGSTIPLLLGFVVIAFLVVAASIAAGDAFVQQQDLQETCDGAAAAAASSADFVAARSGSLAGSLPLANVQEAVAAYLGRDPSRSSVSASAAVVGGTDVAVVCTSRTPVAFGSMFGFGDGIEHRARSTARSPILGP